MSTNATLKCQLSLITALCLGNATALASVLVFDWSVTLLLVLYWLEAGILLVRTGVEGLLAEVPTEPFRDGYRIKLFERLELGSKRGTVEIHDDLPPVHPRNTPAVLSLLRRVAVFWVPTGVVLLFVVPDSLAFDPVAVALVSVGTLAFAYRHWSAFRRSFLDDRRYEEVSASVVWPRRRFLWLAFLTFSAAVYGNPAVVSSADASGSVRTSVGAMFLFVACCKLAYETYRVTIVGYPTRYEHRSGLLSFDWVSGSIGEERTAIESPESEPTAVFRTERRAVRVDGILYGLGYGILYPGSVGIAGIVLLILADVIGPVFGGLLVAGFVGSVVAGQIWLFDTQYGHLEYRVYSDELVVYDRKTDEPQLHVTSSDFREVSVSRGITQRLSGVGRLKLTQINGDVHVFRYLAEPDELAEKFRL
ncbi:DUF6498-containing protein [Halorussus pelagicus]|uniref:DUF6498-containing protein n=1 Tax=Halorussus pelagicus TaxID=2505977 RepID=UPI000FFCA1B3|nr:DUF6498-containing protein [Halorussus pelagicus]